MNNRPTPNLPTALVTINHNIAPHILRISQLHYTFALQMHPHVDYLCTIPDHLISSCTVSCTFNVFHSNKHEQYRYDTLSCLWAFISINKREWHEITTHIWLYKRWKSSVSCSGIFIAGDSKTKLIARRIKMNIFI